MVIEKRIFTSIERELRFSTPYKFRVMYNARLLSVFIDIVCEMTAFISLLFCSHKRCIFLLKKHDQLNTDTVLIRTLSMAPLSVRINKV